MYRVVLAVFTLFAASTFAKESRLPNVLFILVDDMGFGELGCYGQKVLETPRLDSLASQGMLFTQFYAGSTVCAPSRSVLMTGLHTGHTRVRGNDRGRAYLGQTLVEEDLTLAELFQESGYRTALVGKWGLGELGSSGVPNRQGFETYYGFLNQAHAHNHFPSFLIRDGEREVLPNDLVQVGDVEGAGYSKNQLVYANDLFFAEAKSVVRRFKDDPFFLYLALTIPHANNEASNELGDGMEVPNYGRFAGEDWPRFHKGHAEMNARIDEGVGGLLDLLDELGLSENTIVVFTSDNGPHNEGGFGYNPEFFDTNGSLSGIKRDLKDGGIRVPMIVRWPGVVEAGSVESHVSYFADFMPTFSKVLGSDLQETDGLSLLPVLTGQGKQEEHPFLYWEFYGNPRSQAVLLEGRWKGIRSFGPSRSFELYDLSADPGEYWNRADSFPETVERIKAIMDSQHVPNEAWAL